MFGIGMPEMLLIVAIALIVIGPKKLPDLAKSLGRALGEFKRATSDLKETLEIDTDLSDVKKAFDDMNKDVRDTVAEGLKEAEEQAGPSSGREGETGDQTLPGRETADLFSADIPQCAPADGARRPDLPDEAEDVAEKEMTPADRGDGRGAPPDEREASGSSDDPHVEQEESARHG